MSIFSRKQTPAPVPPPVDIVAPATPPAPMAATTFAPNYASGLAYITDGHMDRTVEGAHVADILLIIYDNAVAGRKRNNQYIAEKFYDRGIGDAYILASHAGYRPTWGDVPPPIDRPHFIGLIAAIQAGRLRFVSNAFDDDLPDYFIEDCSTFDRWTLDEWGKLPFTYPDEPDKM